MNETVEPASLHITVRPLREDDLPEADRVVRLAFGTFIGLADPMTFMGDADYVRTRWRANPSAAFAADAGGRLAGSNFATRWGSVGFFGPLSVRPDLWDRGIAKRLMEPVMGCFERWETRHAGLFTFASSEKHVGLYQRFGFWPRFLTAIMSKAASAPKSPIAWRRLSDLPEQARAEMLPACRTLAGAIYDGLDPSPEIRAVVDQRLGDILLLQDGDGLVAFAVCHYGRGTEAGSTACYVKFAAVSPGAQAARHFERLLGACEALTAEQGLPRLVAGVNTARHEAYRAMLARGFRTDLQGVVMQRGNDAGYNRPGVYLIDDWR